MSDLPSTLESRPSAEPALSVDFSENGQARGVIPPCFCKPDIGFCLVRIRNKKPFEIGWQEKPYRFDDPKLSAHLRNGGNVGIIGGYGDIFILDSDIPELQDLLNKNLPDTLEVRRKSSKSGHKYYLCSGATSLKLKKGDVTAGDFQYFGKQAVCPPSIHPCGEAYEVVDVTQTMARIDFKFLLELVKPYLDREQKANFDAEGNVKPAADPKPIYEWHKKVASKITIKDVMVYYGFDVSRNPTMCIMHKSHSGQPSFYWNEKNNQFKCFGCEARGGNMFGLLRKLGGLQ